MDGYVPWVCPACRKGEGEAILALADTLIRCTCGAVTRSDREC